MRVRFRGPGLCLMAAFLGGLGCGQAAGSGTTGAGTSGAAAGTTGVGTSGAAAGTTEVGAGTATGVGAASGAATGTGTATAVAAPGGRCPEGMVLVPEGTFRMGAAEDDKDAEADERPARDVHLRAFCIGKTEVTVAKYTRCVAEPRGGVACTPASATVVSKGLAPADVIFWSKFCNAGAADRGEHPVNCLDWAQAGTYCKWAGGRLPTEAEWEYAARGTDGRKYPWGNEAPGPSRLNACGDECAKAGAALGRKDKKRMFEGEDGAEATAPVGRYPAGASPFGALDMGGNVWEWTADGYAPYDAARTDNPVHEAGPQRVVRGGHWLTANPGSPRAANREKRDESKRLEDVGFRCAAAPSP